jgi:hypothetical protein
MATKRQIFYSFHYENDVNRVQLIRNIGALEDNKPASINEWEQVKRGGDTAIERWIDDNMKYRSCVVVLVGEETANRKWVQHEIKKAWREGKGVVGIHIHNIKCMNNGYGRQGQNPFSQILVGNRSMSSIVKCYNPSSNDAYNDIRNNIEKWIEEAISIRNQN